MKRSSLIVTGLLLSALSLGGCATKETTQPKQYSGFLSDYSRLQSATSPTGKPVMRWMAPGFKLDNYRYVQVKSIGFYPMPSPTEQIRASALNDLQAYTSQQIKAAFGRRLQVVEPGSMSPPSETLILRAALTGVSSGNKPLRGYEVIPIALVAAAATTAAGARDQETQLFVEAELLDASTGKPVIQVVRKGFGKELENKEQQVTLATLKGVVDGMVRDIEKF